MNQRSTKMGLQTTQRNVKKDIDRYSIKCRCPKDSNDGNRFYIGNIHIANCCDRSELVYCRLLIIYIIFICISNTTCTVTTETKQFCDNLNRLSRPQKTFCYLNIQTMKVLIDGHKLGHKQCKETFRYSSETLTRWNCSNKATEGNRNMFFGVAQSRRKYNKILYCVYFHN